jgi:glycosyltransferase involved in cell wall biosynthesis
MAELPVVASNLEGIAEALQNHKNGILLPERDAQAYHKTIKEMLSNEKSRITFGKQARRYTISNFGWPKIADRYLAIYKKVIS